MRKFKITIPCLTALAMTLLANIAQATPFVPAALTPGSKYHLVFISRDQRDGTSGLISDYNTFVQTQAALNPIVTGTNVGVQYTAIASTSGTSAFANAPITAPVYNFFGQKVADNSADMWDASLDTAVFYDQFAASGFPDVWTGSQDSGLGFVGNELGTAEPRTGLANASNNLWIDDTVNGQTGLMSIYGLSQELTVPNHSVPEPSALILLSMLSMIGAAARKKRYRR